MAGHVASIDTDVEGGKGKRARAPSLVAWQRLRLGAGALGLGRRGLAPPRPRGWAEGKARGSWAASALCWAERDGWAKRPGRVDEQDGLRAGVAQGCCSGGPGKEKDRLGQGDSAQGKGKGISPFMSKGI